MSDQLDLTGDNPWQTTHTRVVYDNGNFRLREDIVVQPDGAPGRYTFVELPWPIVAVVPLAENGDVYLVRQWRYPWQCNSWEIPAGHGEENESPLESARRELAEEVGLQAATWEPLGGGFTGASFNARYFLFLARDLGPTAGHHVRDGAEHDLFARPMPLQEAVAAAIDGRIEHTLSVIGLLRAARRLGV